MFIFWKRTNNGDNDTGLNNTKGQLFFTDAASSTVR